jgi:uroporphyrinogen III methyltransferase/synthase
MKVTLVGAGPGGKDLLTLKGARRIQNADVVLYDRFVSEEILAMIPQGAEKINVGKYAGNHPVPQDEINRLLLEKARQGHDVVRLKGGDPFVFGRGGEELEILAENGIPFEVVPGVISAIAGAAYAGIPVTHRDYSSSVHILTGHAKNNEAPDIVYKALVKLNGTLVFMMGVAAVGAICENCIAGGMDPQMPAAIVENAAANSMRKFLGTVGTLESIARENNVQSPSVIIIGKVCLFSERFDWFARDKEIRLPLRNKYAVVVKVKPGTSKLSNMLMELGCRVTEIRCFRTVPLITDTSMMEKAIRKIKDYSWLVFTSGLGVNIFFDYLIENKFDIRKLTSLKIACVGSETEKEINKRGLLADYRPDEYNGKSLANGLTALVKDGEKLLIARAKDGAQDLTRLLANAGIAFDDVPVYEKIKETGNMIIENNFDFAAFTSSSAVEGFVESSAKADLSKIKAVCIGEKTAQTAKSYGMDVYVSAKAAIESMVEKIKELSS